MSRVFIACHLVFSTKYHRRTIPFEYRGYLYAYISKVLEARQCKVFQVNGYVDHVHAIFLLHPSNALADLIRELKTESSKTFQKDGHFPYFEGWGQGYYCHSISVGDLNSAVEYVKNQENHHTVEDEDFMKEIQWMVLTHGLRWYPDDWN